MKIITISTALLFFIPAISCSKESGLTGSFGKIKTKKADNNSDTNEQDIETDGQDSSNKDEEGEVADKPVDVTGSYLTCDDVQNEDADYTCRFTYKHSNDIKEVDDTSVNGRNDKGERFAAKPAIVISGPDAEFTIPIPKGTGNISRIVIDFEVNEIETSISASNVGPGKSEPLDNVVIKPAVALDAHLMFVSSETFALGPDPISEFNQNDEADDRCKTLAILADLPRVGWKAIISDSKKDALSVMTLKQDVYDVTGTRIAVLADFWTVPHLNPANRTEGGTVLSSDRFAWTGTTVAGLRSQFMCEDWRGTEPTGKGTVGKIGDPVAWLASQDVFCTTDPVSPAQKNRFHLYCLSKEIEKP